MNWLEFSTTMTSHLVWPVVAVIVALVFRAPIARLIDRIKSITAPGGLGAQLATLENQVDAARESLKAADTASAVPAQRPGEMTPGSPGPVSESSGLLDEGFVHLALIADENPSYAVVAAWSLLESAMRNALEMIWLDPHNRNKIFPRSTTAVINELRRMDALTPEVSEALSSLRRLRNQIAHGAVNPEVGSATAYVENTRALAQAIVRNVTVLRAGRTYEEADTDG